MEDVEKSLHAEISHPPQNRGNAERVAILRFCGFAVRHYGPRGAV
jgi:hypothetical protein